MDNLDKIVKKYLKPQFQLRDILLKKAFKAWMIGAGIITVLLLCTGEWTTPAEWQGVIIASLFFSFFLVFIPFLAIKGHYGSYKVLEKSIMEDEKNSTTEANKTATNHRQCENEEVNTFSEIHKKSKNEHNKADLQHEISILRKDNNQLAEAVMQLQKENSFLQEQLKKLMPSNGW